MSATRPTPAAPTVAAPLPRTAPESARGGTAAGRWSAAALSLGALGVVYGDIGTSPLYTVQLIFAGTNRLPPTRAHVYGGISLIFLALMTIVTLKYVLLIMRADNHGEGGIMALVAIIQRSVVSRRKGALILVGIMGASLFYGDGMLTPAISVVSAVSGLQVASPALAAQVIPISLVILTALFAVQRFGTGAVGALFGPVMVVWFGSLGTLGVVEVAAHPGILLALSPSYGVAFLTSDPGPAFLSLGSVFLAVTGAEAIYADMGHFGRRAITRAWLVVALPALVLNYMGQGALILARPGTVDNPFFRLVPGWGQLPMVVLATAATVIASQAVISGAYSVTQQVVQLGYLPRVSIRHTSRRIMGQIYIPVVNWVLLAAVLVLVVTFRSPTGLANAYGIALSAIFATNTFLAFIVFRKLWRRPLWLVLPGGAAFVAVELTFFAANLPKVLSGGWLPLAIAAIVFVVLTTWRRGQAAIAQADRDNRVLLRRYLNRMVEVPPRRVPGTAVFLTSDPHQTPPALIRNVERNQVVHEQVVLLDICTVPLPQVPDDRRITVQPLRLGFVVVTARVGYQEEPDAVALLALARGCGLAIELDRTSYFLDGTILQATGTTRLAGWRKRLFMLLYRNATPAGRYLNIPADAALEVGRHIEI
ncbi:MAG TPA: KUP/HAK/KT family potassium transporter [Gaiellales bacterium]|nr:KUP/HAK/KT family potassium transporter [Gaiellales bacterium]